MKISLSCLNVRSAIEHRQPLTEALQTHADGCAQCQQALQTELTLRTWFQQDVSADADVAASVMARVNGLPKPTVSLVQKARRPVTGWLVPAVAAAVFVLLWVSSPTFTDNPVSNRLARLSEPVDDLLLVHLTPTDHDLMDHDPTDVLSDVVDF